MLVGKPAGRINATNSIPVVQVNYGLLQWYNHSHYATRMESSAWTRDS